MKKPYIIIYEFSYDKLEERVSEAMLQGYKPSGSLIFRPQSRILGTRDDYSKDAFIQPMITMSAII